MSRTRKLVGLGIVILVVVVFPIMYYLLSKTLDTLLGLSPVYMANANLFAAALAALAGLFWITWAYSYLHFVGKGSPVEVFGVALYPTQNLVTTGPYAYTRNPMMLGLLSILFAVALAMGSISGMVMTVFWTIVAVLYIRQFEEPGLVRRFGDAYIEYRNSVPILMPRLRPR